MGNSVKQWKLPQLAFLGLAFKALGIYIRLLKGASRYHGDNETARGNAAGSWANKGVITVP